MAQLTRVARDQYQKEIIKIFDSLQGKHDQQKTMHNKWMR